MISICMMNNKCRHFVFATSLTCKAASAFNRSCKAESRVFFPRLQCAIDDISAGTGTETSFSSLKLVTASNDLPAQLAWRAFNTSKRTVILTGTQEIGAEGLSTSEAGLVNIPVGITATLRAIRVFAAISMMTLGQWLATDFTGSHIRLSIGGSHAACQG